MKTAKQILTEALNAYEDKVCSRSWYGMVSFDIWRCMECKAEASSVEEIQHAPHCLLGRDLACIALARKWLEEAALALSITEMQEKFLGEIPLTRIREEEE